MDAIEEVSDVEERGQEAAGFGLPLFFVFSCRRAKKRFGQGIQPLAPIVCGAASSRVQWDEKI